ncbi:MAG: MiaB/RimO family radical SAM methylthiotransferase, partial [Chitinispirillaceae bacterium]|nr:MiaB/RimO family radical SAM methylthiotransferase [Chitinispirillaceae bacterium]
MPNVALYNLGCSKNIVDGERILHLFRNAGYSIIDNPSRADTIVVNTCAFIQEAQEEAIETILTAASVRKDRQTRLIVSGCFSQRFRNEVAKRFPEVDLWVGVDDWEQLLGTELGVAQQDRFERELTGRGATQHLKIAEGCSHRCSFCVIPSIRGPFRSRPVTVILDEARWLESNGTRELILVAQDSSWYGRDIGLTLTRLLEQLLAAVTIPWIRIMYLHPQFVDDELLRLIAAEPRICSYFDIPLQHIADPVLASMKRRPGAKGIHRLIENIRMTVPDASIRSAFILGYPGE